MFIKQLSVFVENRVGAASDILDILSDNNININALSIADTSDYGIMRMIVSDPDAAKSILREMGIMVKRTEVLAIPIGDRPGGLAYVLKVLKGGGVSVEYMYAFVGKKNGAIVVVKVDSPYVAVMELKENGITPLDFEELF